MIKVTRMTKEEDLVITPIESDYELETFLKTLNHRQYRILIGAMNNGTLRRAIIDANNETYDDIPF